MKAADRLLLFLLTLSARIVGLLPFRMKYYGMVPALCFFLHRVAGYRRKVVRENLAGSFPEKTLEELKAIEKEFYLHLSELFIDTLELYTISEEKIRERFQYADIPAAEEGERGRTWICAMAHYGAWEYTIGFPLFTSNRVAAVYKPLHSAVMESYYRKMRARFGTEPVPMKHISREILLTEKNHKKPLTVALIADQTPKRDGTPHWFPFLHRQTLFFMGMERLALRLNLPVYFLEVEKMKRGNYQAKFVEIYDGREPVEEGEIMRRYVAKLEEMIRREPPYWLWSHKRWKHKPENHG